MRIATYNVEWFTGLFNKNDKLLIDDNWSSRYQITRRQQIEALAHVFTALRADAIMVIEAPNTGHRNSSTRALEGFANHFGLPTNKAVEGFANETQQEITLLFNPDKLTATHDPIGTPNDSHAPRFDAKLRLDLDIDDIHETVRFSKPPLELNLTTRTGQHLRMIGVHVKSKAPHGASNPKEIIRYSIENRRKQLAQCIWLRRRIEHHLAAKEPLVVLGDLNDGPGLDEYEIIFGHSGVEVVMGCDRDVAHQLYDPNALTALRPRAGNGPATSRFYLKPQRMFLNALLDYIMVSPDLVEQCRGWTIWHPFDNPDCFNDPELQNALLTASDHFPVVLDIDI